MESRRELRMIELTRLNGNLLIVNSDLIKCAESSPDTMLTLINGEKIVVLESCALVIERVIAYRARLLSEVMKMSGVETPPSLASGAAAAQALSPGVGRAPVVEVELGEDTRMAMRRRRTELA